MHVAFSDRQVLIDGTPDLLFGGEFQYFRIRPELWRPSLEQFKAAGLNVLSAYVPWIWHEVEEGRWDFTGETDPARDLVGLLSLCEEIGLPIVLKPGPYIFAEYQGFGVPYWLREHHPDYLMAVHKPQVYPQPSLNHPGYLALVERWFEQVAAIVRPFVARGVVVAIQIDNETGYPQFGQGPHLVDRNPDTLDLLHAALRDRFSSIDELNLLWGTSFKSFEELELPEERFLNAAQMDTMARYVEDYVVAYLSRLKRMWERIDLGVFLFLNDIWLECWPSHLGKKNTVAPMGFDIYPRFSDLPVPFDMPFSPAFVPKLFGAFLKGGPLVAAELGCGWLDPGCEVSPAATWQSTMAAIAHGTKAIFYYTLMDGRDPDGQYIFRPLIGLDGEVLPRMEAARQAATICQALGKRIADSEEVLSRVAVLHYPALTREMMSAALSPLETVVKGSNKAVDEALTIVSVNAGLYGALAEAGYDPAVLNLERASLEELSRHDVIFFNSIGTVDVESQAKLNAFVRQGGKLVTLGTPFAEDSALFPAKVYAVANPQVPKVMLQVAWDYVKLYVRIARRFTHRFSAFTVESMYPAMMMVKHATRAGVWLKAERKGGRLWGSRLVTLSRLGESAREILTYRGGAAGYEADVQAGKSVFIGTLLGASFDSPGFYLDPAERKRSVSDFLGHLLANWAVLPLVSPIDDVETVVREGTGFRLAFLFNRGPAKSFDLSINRPWEGYTLTSQHSAYGSHARWEGERLMGTIEANDVLCLLWESAV